MIREARPTHYRYGDAVACGQRGVVGGVGNYTSDKAKVTCKRCLADLARDPR